MSQFTKLISVFCLIILVATTSSQAGEIHEAVAAGDLNKVRMLLKADPILLESEDNNGNTPLNLACFHDFTKEPAVARFLMDKGANVNTKNNEGFTPLHGACAGTGPDFNLVQALIAKGANANVKQRDGNIPLTPLQGAAMNGDLKTAKLLIDHGADVDTYDKVTGSTILQMAITFNSNEDMSKLLIESGAKPNQKDVQGNTELHLAAMRGFDEVIRLLVKHGADVNAVNNSNHTALYYAAKHGYRSASDALIVTGADKSTIIETNYGKAPQLSATLKQDEAYLWSMKTGGYAIKTKDHLLVLSQIISIDSSLEAGLANGQLNPSELTGQNIIILTHYPRADFLNSDEGKLAKSMPEVEWVFYSGRPTEVNKDIQGLPSYHLIGPNENISFGGIQVYTTPQKTGVGFLFEVDGVKIFNGLSYTCTNESSTMELYRQGIDSMKPYGPIDIAILRASIHGRHPAYEAYLYMIDQLSPKAAYLTGGEGNPGYYPRLAKFLQERNIQVKHPETGIEGDRFHYLRD